MKTFFLVLTLIIITGCASTRDFSYIPSEGYAPTVDVEFIEPSVTVELKPTQKISKLTKRNYDGETVVQRLTKNSYWVQSGFYNTTFYVGKKSVLVMDPLAFGKGKKVIEVIKSITDKPISTVIYSHQHEDHIGDIKFFIDEATIRGHKLRIIATNKTVKEMRHNGSKLPRATEILSEKKNTTKFEDQVVKVIFFTPASHSIDSAAWLLVKEKIIHSPDIVNPDQVPFLGFGGSRTFSGYEENLEQLQKIDWLFFSSGHGNIGSKKDIEFMLTYVKDLVRYVKEAKSKVSFGKYFVAKYNNHQASVHAYHKAVESYIVSSMRAKYGEIYGFEASLPYQIRMVQKSEH